PSMRRQDSASTCWVAATSSFERSPQSSSNISSAAASSITTVRPFGNWYVTRPPGITAGRRSSFVSSKAVRFRCGQRSLLRKGPSRPPLPGAYDHHEETSLAPDGAARPWRGNGAALARQHDAGADGPRKERGRSSPPAGCVLRAQRNGAAVLVATGPGSSGAAPAHAAVAAGLQRERAGDWRAERRCCRSQDERRRSFVDVRHVPELCALPGFRREC